MGPAPTTTTVSPGWTRPPEVRFAGPIERLVPDSTATELLATPREALANVARHALASRSEVEVSVHDDLHLKVRDDGIGIDTSDPSVGKGLANMRQRAEALGGSVELLALPDGDTEVSWRVPLA